MAISFTQEEAQQKLGKQVRLKRDMYQAQAGDIGTILGMVPFEGGFAVQVFWQPTLSPSPLYSDFFLPDDFSKLLEEL